MNAIDRAALLVKPYGPRVPVGELVMQLNIIFHKYEAAAYDDRHPEIFSELPNIWAEMYQAGAGHLARGPLRVLDYGCGTGFAAAQFISLAGAPRIGEFVCYDPSKEMLERCRQRFSESEIATKYVSALPAGPFDVVLTNSLLHHLPDIADFLEHMEKMLGHSGVWFQGHEPNRQYYHSPSSRELFALCRGEARRQKLMSPSWYFRKIAVHLGWQPTPELFTSQEAVGSKLLERRPPPAVIAQLVDVGVPTPGSGSESTLAFDPADIEKIDPALSVIWRRTYNFKGRFHQYRFSDSLEEKLRRFSAEHPGAGASVSSVILRQPRNS